MRRILIFIAGTKGGVGKSFAAIALAGAVADLNLSLKVYDSDSENRTVSGLLTEYSVFLDEAKAHYPLDTVIDGLYAESKVQVTLVDMKAGTSRSTQGWFSSVPWDELKKTDVDVYVAGCITSDPDSVRTFVPWINYFRGIDFTVNFLLIKNEKDGDNFLTCTSLLEPALQKLELNHTIFRFSAIEQEYINTLNNNNLTLRGHMNGKGKVLVSVMQKSRLRNHYFALTDQLVEFFGAKLEKDDLTDLRRKQLEASRRRMALRKEKPATTGEQPS